MLVILVPLTIVTAWLFVESIRCARYEYEDGDYFAMWVLIAMAAITPFLVACGVYNIVLEVAALWT